MSPSEVWKPSCSKSKSGGEGTWWTSWRSARVLTFISSSTPAMRLMTNECGPATLTTIGASISVPSVERHAGDAAVGAADLGDLGAEEELAALGLGRALEVVAWRAAGR